MVVECPGMETELETKYIQTSPIWSWHDLSFKVVKCNLQTSNDRHTDLIQTFQQIMSETEDNRVNYQNCSTLYYALQLLHNEQFLYLK